MEVLREMTPKEKRAIKKLVVSRCANYDKEYGCLLLDCECPMFNAAYVGSSMCRWFRDAVLPNDPTLEAALRTQPTKICKQCGKRFPANGRKAYCSESCSESCAEAARREKTALRVGKHRSAKQPISMQ